MPTPASGPLSFSALASEYLNNSSATISMSQLGYGGSINKRNDCSDYARSNASVPFHSIVANLPVYNGPGSNINMLQYYNRNAYSAPPNGTFVTSGDNLEYNFTGLLNSGRDYNPNQTKRENALFMHITNSGKLYANDTGSYAAYVGSQNNTILYFKNTGSILGCGGVGGNGGGADADNPGGAGTNGGPALFSSIYTLLNNTGVIYGGGGGGGGGGSGHRAWNTGYGAAQTNSGGGGGGGGGGQSAVQVSGGSGGRAAPNYGGAGGSGGVGNESGAGAGGGGGDQGWGGNFGGGGGAGGSWGNSGGNGGGSSAGGGAGGSGGDSFLFASGALIAKGTTAGYTAVGGPAGSLSPSGTFSGSYGIGLQYYEYYNEYGELVSGYSCGACDNQVSAASWSNVSPTTVAFTGSGMVINVNRIPSGSSVSGYEEYKGGVNCGTCTYTWYYTASIVNGGSSYIPGRSVVRVNLDGNNVDFVVG